MCEAPCRLRTLIVIRRLECSLWLGILFTFKALRISLLILILHY